jgi:peptide/nickel transport system ATP-binding protein/peptide/nickel transport system permease protein
VTTSSATYRKVGNVERGWVLRQIRRDPFLLFALGWLGVVLFVAIAGVAVAPYDPTQIDLARRLLPPLSSHGGDFFVAGTDQVGRDYLSQLIVGTRASVGFGFVSAAIATISGLITGSIAGYVGGRADMAVTRLVDAWMSFPALLLSLLIVVSLGPSVAAVVVVLALAGWPRVTRLARGLALEIRQTAYVDSAKALDGSTRHIVRRHVVPNLVSTVLAYGTLLIATLMLAAAGLDFLGLGIQPPDTSWGVLVADGRDTIQRAPWLIALPGLAIFLTAFSVNLAAITLQRYVDQSGVGLRSILRGRNAGVVGPTPALDLIEETFAPAEPEALPIISADPSSLDDPSSPDEPVDAILAVRHLSVDYVGASGVAQAVRDVTWSVGRGEVVALVGESGSGKSATAKAVMDILERPQGRITAGEIWLDGQDLLKLPGRERRRRYGRVLGMVQQDAIAALNPVMTIGKHLEEAIAAHRQPTGASLRADAVELLERVGIPDPARRYGQYPFELSGGMCQRVLIAMAIANRPKVLVADEPTTALDVTYQAQIMDLLARLRVENDMSMLLISHDLGLVSQRADRIVVMYGGRVMESGPVRQVIEQPAHPYTRALLAARPDITMGRSRLAAIPGAPPSALRLPPGCPFQPRCPMAIAACAARLPITQPVAPGRASACIRASELVA